MEDVNEVFSLISQSSDLGSGRKWLAVSQRLLLRRALVELHFSAVSWRRKWQPTPVLLPGKSHGQRSLLSYSPWGRRESDATERLPSLCLVVFSAAGPGASVEDRPEKAGDGVQAPHRRHH